MTKPTDEERRPLRLLARSPDGCTEAMLMANGFGAEVLGGFCSRALRPQLKRSSTPAGADTGRSSGSRRQPSAPRSPANKRRQS
jgi:hypothetical protein